MLGVKVLEDRALISRGKDAEKQNPRTSEEIRGGPTKPWQSLHAEPRIGHSVKVFGSTYPRQTVIRLPDPMEPRFCRRYFLIIQIQTEARGVNLSAREHRLERIVLK